MKGTVTVAMSVSKVKGTDCEDGHRVMLIGKGTWNLHVLCINYEINSNLSI
jgi:hypothetical protein